MANDTGLRCPMRYAPREQGSGNADLGGTRRDQRRGRLILRRWVVTNWALLFARLTIAGCLVPAAIAHVSNISGFALSLWMKRMPAPNAVATACVMAEVFG